MNPRARAIAVALTIAATGAIAAAQDALTQLGITQNRAKEAVFDSFITGSISLAGKAEVFKAASPQVRAGMVTAVATLGRAFIESTDFEKRYADHREANGPDPLPAEQTADQIFAKQRKDWEEQVEGIRAQFSEITPAQQKTLETGFDEMRARFDAMEKEGRPELEQSLQTQRAAIVRSREAAMADFERVIPADPRVLVASRLRRFLDLSRDIDYSAKLVERDKKMRFADPTLESKPADWKLCFRAGRAATETARVFAQKWLSDLEAKGVK
ncbi:MAG: hypothetical protein ABI665_10280 [Vicinamibacterales bacterium]